MLRQRGKRELNFALINQKYLPFTWENWKFQLENQMVSLWEASENMDYDFLLNNQDSTRALIGREECLHESM